MSRTFSKVYGMAAMRLGCLFSQSGNVEFLHKAQSPYSVNTLAALAARAAIQDPQPTSKNTSPKCWRRASCCTSAWKSSASHTTRARPISCCSRPASAPFRLRDELRRRGVLVRDRSYEIPGCVRVTVGTRDQIRRFLTELEQIW